MAIDKHPSRDASKPTKAPALAGDKVTRGSGQKSVAYGARHELSCCDPNRSEMKHHFEDHVGVENSMRDGGSPQRGKQSDRPAKIFGKIKQS